MKTLKERLEYCSKLRPHIKQVDLVRACNLKTSSVSNWFTGKTKRIMGDNLMIVAKLYEVNPLWLSSGEGSPTDSQIPGAQTIHNFKEIPVVGYAKLGNDEENYFVNLEYPPGHGEDYLSFPSKDPHAYALKCFGDSMLPRIRHGEYVIIEPSHEVLPGDEVLVKDKNGSVMIKVWRYTREGLAYFESINTSSAPFSIPVEEIEQLQYVAGIAKSSLKI